MATPPRSIPAATEPASEPVTPTSTEQQLASALAQIAALMEKQTQYNEYAAKNAPRRKKTMAEYLREKPRKRLLHDVYQNGRPVNPQGLSVETIEKLDTLATGIYCDGMVQVVRISSGPKGINSRIHLMYNNRAEGDRMAFNMRFPTFTKLVNDILADMVVQKVVPVHDAAADPVVPEFPEEL